MNLHRDLFEENLRHCPEVTGATEAFRIMDVLRREGFVAYLAGGCVRDALLGKSPKDYDVATDATPQSVRKVFGKSNTLAFGASFGVIGVLPPSDPNRRGDHVLPTEVATFRSDGDYSDGRRPDSVHFGNAQQDALRRDFTINGLFYDPVTLAVIDFVGGQEDLSAGLLRTIGSAEKRFAEDKLRMLRAVRFATTLGFRIDPETHDAILQHAGDISVVSGERIGAEMRRVVVAPDAVTGLSHLCETGLSDQVMPGLNDIPLDRLTSLLAHLPHRSFAASLTCLAIEFEDAPDCLQQREDSQQPGFLRRIANRWRLSTEEVRRAGAAAQQHGVLIQASRLPWSSVQPVMIDRDFQEILSVATAVAITDGQDLTGLKKVRQAANWPEQQLNPPPLLTGDDLRKQGIPAGPQYRVILESIRRAQLDDEIDSPDEAWQVVKQQLSSKRT